MSKTSRKKPEEAGRTNIVHIRADLRLFINFYTLDDGVSGGFEFRLGSSPDRVGQPPASGTGRCYIDARM